MNEIENILWNTYSEWKEGNFLICNRLGHESTMVLIPQYELTTKKHLYIIDFVEPSLKIAIELDGFNWHFKNKKQVIHDKKRERLITLEGFTFLRYPGAEVYADPLAVLEEIYSTYCFKALAISKEEADRIYMQGVDKLEDMYQ